MSSSGGGRALGEGGGGAVDDYAPLTRRARATSREMQHLSLFQRGPHGNRHARGLQHTPGRLGTLATGWSLALVSLAS